LGVANTLLSGRREVNISFTVEGYRTLESLRRRERRRER
jgi:hypothetical protein